MRRTSSCRARPRSTGRTTESRHSWSKAAATLRRPLMYASVGWSKWRTSAHASRSSRSWPVPTSRRSCSTSVRIARRHSETARNLRAPSWVTRSAARERARGLPPAASRTRSASCGSATPRRRRYSRLSEGVKLPRGSDRTTRLQGQSGPHVRTAGRRPASATFTPASSPGRRSSSRKRFRSPRSSHVSSSRRRGAAMLPADPGARAARKPSRVCGRSRASTSRGSYPKRRASRAHMRRKVLLPPPPGPYTLSSSGAGAPSHLRNAKSPGSRPTNCSSSRAARTLPRVATLSTAASPVNCSNSCRVAGLGSTRSSRRNAAAHSR